MRSLAFTLGVTAVLGLAVSCRRPPSAEATALHAKILAALTGDDPAAVMAQAHEPRSWDPSRVAEDRRQLIENFGVLLNEFGKISSPRATGSIAYYQVELAGADLPYWQALQNRGSDSKSIYRVDFSNTGPGVVAVSLTRASGAWELHSIALGIEPSRPGSRETIMRIGRAFFRRMDPQMPEGRIDALLEQMVRL